MAITKDGYSHSHAPGAFSTNHISKVVCILNSAHTGGVITASKNGASLSIRRPGEYIVFTNERWFSVSTVTSGTLVYATFDIVSEILEADNYDYDDVDMFVQRLEADFRLCSKGEFIQAVKGELGNDKSNGGVSHGMILCLSTLYPIVAFDPSGPYLETDPDSLKGRDAVLYEFLKDTFEVSLVTVYVQRRGTVPYP